MLTQARLKETLDYDPKTGHFVRTKIGKGRCVGSVAGGFDSYGYRNIDIDGYKYKEHRLVWLWVYGYFPEHELDHIDRNPANNKINNLREISHQCNLRNTGNRVDNKTGVKGVCLDVSRQKWLAQINIGQRLVFLGRYSDFDEAVCVRLAAEQAEGWGGCDSNSPAYKYVTKNIKSKDPNGPSR